MVESIPIFYHGSHFDVGCFITGEQRVNLTRSDEFGHTKVRHPVISSLHTITEDRSPGPGAWELTARFSYIDYTDSSVAANAQGLRFGVRMPRITAGVNWYLTDNLRTMINYTYAVPDEPYTSVSSASVIGIRLGLFW